MKNVSVAVAKTLWTKNIVHSSVVCLVGTTISEEVLPSSDWAKMEAVCSQMLVPSYQNAEPSEKCECLVVWYMPPRNSKCNIQFRLQCNEDIGLGM
jgi:hypothetical protein